MRNKLALLIVLTFLVGGCLDEKTNKTYTGNYVDPIDWCPYTLDGKWPWDGELNFTGPCGKEFRCEWKCESVDPQAVPVPGAVLLAGLGTLGVGWLRRKRVF